MPLFSGLLESNGTVTVQKRTTGRDSAGGSTETWADVATGVPVLVSGISGVRDGRYDGKNNVIKGTCTGEDSSLGVQNIRLLFTAGQFSGLYGHSDSLDDHGGVIDQFLDAPWFSVRFSIYKIG